MSRSPVPAPPLRMVVVRPETKASRCNEAAAGATDNRRGTAPTECVKQNRRRTAVECLDSAAGNIEVPFKSRKRSSYMYISFIMQGSMFSA